MTLEAKSPLRWIGHLAAVGVAGVFLFAAYEKILQPRDFINNIGHYRILPDSLKAPFGLLLPWWEVGAAIAILWPRTRTAGAVLIGAMSIMFMIAVSYAAFYLKIDISCGCFGKAHSSTIGWKTLALDAACLAAAILAVVFSGQRMKTADRLAKESEMVPDFPLGASAD